MSKESPELDEPPQDSPMKEDGWLVSYYQKARSEKVLDLNRRDQFTNWGLTLFLGVLALYAELINRKLVPIWRIGLLLIASLLLLRFFIHACLAYAWARKWNHIVKTIEQYWLQDVGINNVDDVIKVIRLYDHNQNVPITRRKIIWAQLRTGYLIIFPVLIFLVIKDTSNITIGLNENILFIGFLLYFLYEAASFLGYSKINIPPLENDNASKSLTS